MSWAMCNHISHPTAKHIFPKQTGRLLSRRVRSHHPPPPLAAPHMALRPRCRRSSPPSPLPAARTASRGRTAPAERPRPTPGCGSCCATRCTAPKPPACRSAFRPQTPRHGQRLPHPPNPPQRIGDLPGQFRAWVVESGGFRFHNPERRPKKSHGPPGQTYRSLLFFETRGIKISQSCNVYLQKAKMKCVKFVAKEVRRKCGPLWPSLFSWKSTVEATTLSLPPLPHQRLQGGAQATQIGIPFK